MSNPKVELLVEQLEKARDETLGLVRDVPADKHFIQLKDGKGTPTWLLGHLANTLNTIILRWILEEPGVLTPEQAKLFSPDFGGGTPVTTDPANYPAWDDLVALYESVANRAVEGVRTLTDSDLPLPLKGRMPEPLRAFFSSNQTALMQMISHDAYHRGQIAILTKQAS